MHIFCTVVTRHRHAILRGVALISSPPSVITFPTSPATVVISGVENGQVWLGHEVRWEQLDDGVIVLDVIGFCDAKPFWCAELVEVTPILWRGNIVSKNPPGFSVVVRPTIEADTTQGESFVGITEVPLPLKEIRSILGGGGVFETPEFHSIRYPIGQVGMHLRCQGGCYLRAGGAWHELSDPSVVADCDFESATRDDLIAFDKAEELAMKVKWPPVETPRREQP